MANQAEEKVHKSAWIAIEKEVNFSSFSFPDYAFRLQGDPKLRTGLVVGDWVIFAKRDGTLTRVGKVTRIRTDLDGLSVYLDRMLVIQPGHNVSDCGLTTPTKGGISRLPWDAFEQTVLTATAKAIRDLPVLNNDDLKVQQAYIRELLQLGVMDDLLGPANGPHEQIVDMGVRDRYLVGKLAPQLGSSGTSGGIEGYEGPLASEADEEEPDDLKVHTGRHETGAEFERSTGRVDAEAEATEEIDAASNQSLVPSSLGM